MDISLESKSFRWVPRQPCGAAGPPIIHRPDDLLEGIDDIVIFTYSYVSCHDLFLLDSGDTGIYAQEHPSTSSYRHHGFDLPRLCSESLL
jgi:hypothetical protein